MIPLVFDENAVKTTVSAAEKKAMNSEMTLDIVAEPMDHFTTEDDAFLHKLLNEKKKGEGYNTVIIKDDMKDIAKDVMDHWYAVKGADL